MQINFNPSVDLSRPNFKALNCTTLSGNPVVKKNMPRLTELAKNVNITLKESTKALMSSSISVEMPAIKVIVEPLRENKNLFERIFNFKKCSDKYLMNANEYYYNESFMTVVNRLVNKVSSK